MKIAHQLGEIFAPVTDFVYPPRCPACGDPIGRQTGLCLPCWSALAIPSEPACAACQRPFPEGGPEAGALCAPCLAQPPGHDGIAAATLYNPISRKLVLALKHGGRIALAPMMARLIFARIPSPDPGALIVPVPLHRWRLWRRGFNQAVLLGRELERIGAGRLVPDLLHRTRNTQALGGMGAQARRRTLRGAIGMTQHGRRMVAGRDVLLVDDVLTSGATSEACVKVLKRHGASSVRIACFARVLDEALDARISGGNRNNETPGIISIPGAA